MIFLKQENVQIFISHPWDCYRENCLSVFSDENDRNEIFTSRFCNEIKRKNERVICILISNYTYRQSCNINKSAINMKF